MMKFVMGSAILLMLAACGGNSGGAGSEEVVCGEQSLWAQSGKVDGGNITITCPGFERPAY